MENLEAYEKWLKANDYISWQSYLSFMNAINKTLNDKDFYNINSVAKLQQLFKNVSNDPEFNARSKKDQSNILSGFRTYIKFIEQKNETNDNHFSKEMLIELLRKIGKEAATIFFNNTSRLVDELHLKIDDKRLTYGTRNNKRLSITIGQRYCMAYKTDEELPWLFICDTELPSAKNINVGKYDGDPLAYYCRCLQSDEIEKRFTGIIKACKQELNRTTVSGYRKSNNDFFEKAIFDTTFRNQLFEEAFGVTTNLTGTVWKFGSNWASSKNSFYELIKQRGIVIGSDKKPYSPGDLVLITQGFKVLAITKILEQPEAVTTVVEFKAEFDKYEIPYDVTVNYAKAEWYELQEDEIFTYENQQGFTRVNSSEILNKTFTIWNDRFISYWVFQCNPNEFDFASAVKSNLLNNWTIAAHKDKIKSGDKVILWLTGSKAGCYALAKVTSNPNEMNIASDDKFWKVGPKNSLKAGIEITHNLVEKPLLWETIRKDESLQNLKVGNQGTNFTATRKEYKTILNLIENNNQVMENEIELSLNTIIYGPPGTGKTYSLNNYQSQYFTDVNFVESAEDYLKEKLRKFPNWKIIAAILGVSEMPLSVEEMLNHPIAKAKFKFNVKTKPNNIIWSDLLGFADDNSTVLNEKYRRQIKLFTKTENSKWTIASDKKNDLSDIVGNDLLSIVKNPVLQNEKNTTQKTRFNFITFHQKYSYEDFIEGIKPVLKNESEEDKSNDLQFELKKGIFYNSCLEALKLVGYDSFDECFNDGKDNRVVKFEAAKSDTKKQFALFIDEINRANISAVFGELITLLEDDKRMGASNEMWIELPYSNEKFCVPANLYVIGTMNTADRSIALLDIALRRRFEFKALYPLYIESAWWAQLLEAINLAIYNAKNKNPDFFIGHAFFINKPEADKVKILNTKIIPLLYEYCQNNSDTVKKILADARIQIKVTGIKENFQIIAE